MSEIRYRVRDVEMLEDSLNFPFESDKVSYGSL